MDRWPFERDRAVEISDTELNDIQAQLRNVLSSSGEITLKYFRQKLDVENKLAQGFDPVTVADKECEAFIRERLAVEFPTHNMFGEESGYCDRGGNISWVVDPIDGTRSFICGVPLWGTLMAMNDGKKPVLGGMFQPWSDELFIGSKLGAFLYRGDSEQRLQTSSVRTVAESKLSCTGVDIFKCPRALERFQRLADASRLVRFGMDSYGYCLLAQGGLDLVVEDGLQPYDIQALIPIVEAAGGVITSWQGGDAGLGGSVIAAATPELHAEALSYLQH